MTWDTLRLVAAALFAIFALILIVVPLAQIVKGRLTFRRLWGFFVAGLGFGALAAGIGFMDGPDNQTLIILGIVLTIIGNFAQRRVVNELRREQRK